MKTINSDRETEYSRDVSCYCMALQLSCRSLVGKTRVRAPGQTSKQNTKKYFFGDLISADFWKKSEMK